MDKVKWEYFMIYTIQLHVSIPLKLVHRSRITVGQCHFTRRPYQLKMTKMSTNFLCFLWFMCMQMVRFEVKRILVHECTFNPLVFRFLSNHFSSKAIAKHFGLSCVKEIAIKSGALRNFQLLCLINRLGRNSVNNDNNKIYMTRSQFAKAETGQ